MVQTFCIVMASVVEFRLFACLVMCDRVIELLVFCLFFMFAINKVCKHVTSLSPLNLELVFMSLVRKTL